MYRIVVISEAGDFDTDWKEMKIYHDVGGSTKCEEDPNNLGYDCFAIAQTLNAEKLEIKTENFTTIEKICSLLMLVDDLNPLDCTTYSITEDVSKQPPNLSYVISDPAETTDVTGLFFSDS